MIHCGSRALVVAAILLAPPGIMRAAEIKSASSEDVEAEYTRAINGRATDILNALQPAGSDKSNHVHQIIVDQYRALRSWHDDNDAKLKKLKSVTSQSDPAEAKSAADQIAAVDASLKSLHDRFLASLGESLTPEQVEVVKDKMTYNKVKVTYDAYCEIVPGITDEEKARMMDWLKEAREIAMDCGSAKEKSDVFNKYKGKINNYLTAQGHNVSQAYKDWGARQKAKPKPAGDN